MKRGLTFFVNGRKVVEKRPQPDMTLLTYLRTGMNLTGTKLGCGEGGCGACTVMVSQYDAKSKQVIHKSVNACMAPLASIEGTHVVTVEGIGSVSKGLHPVQERIAKSNGSQCGFCTPGIVMSLYTFLRNNPKATRAEIEHAMDGNLCRCTGYRPILDAAKSFAVDSRDPPCCSGSCANGGCCKRNCTSSEEEKHNMETLLKKNLKSADYVASLPPMDVKTIVRDTRSTALENEPISPNQQEIKFPTALKKFTAKPLRFVGDRVTWHRPVTLAQTLALKAEFPNARVVVGSSEITIDRHFRNMPFPILIHTAAVPELTSVSVTSADATFGASVTLSTLMSTFEQLMEHGTEGQRRTAQAFITQLKLFASIQIRNVASIGGNVVNASPISDLNPLLQAAGAEFTLVHANGQRSVAARNFFTGYKQVDLTPTELLLSVRIPFCREGEYLYSFKQSRRREDDIAIVSAGMRAHVGSDGKVIEAALSFSGMAKTTICAPRAEAWLIGRTLTPDMDLTGLYEALAADAPLPAVAPGGMEAYRQTLAASFLFKFHAFICQQRGFNVQTTLPTPRTLSWGKQVYQVPSNPKALVGADLTHAAARLQVTGDAKYADDVPVPHNTVHIALVSSARAHARLLSVDASAALKAPGVVGFFDHKSIPTAGSNVAGHVIPDEVVFAKDTVLHVGMPIGCVAASTHEEARRAALLVKVEYEDLPSILTIDEAIAAQSFQGFGVHTIHSGDVEARMGEADHVAQGTVYIGGQEHFYLETNSTLVTLNEYNDLRVLSSTQNPQATADCISHALGLKQSQINVVTKRLGGGFGGKETRSAHVAVYPALVAHLLQLPAKFTLERNVDMALTGQRHPFKFEYKVGFSSSGRVKALDMQLWSNGGWSLDLSQAVCDRALLHADGVYNWPAIRVRGQVCKTHLPSNTAFRGFGGPQGMIPADLIMDKIAATVGRPVHEVKELNFYKVGDKTHYQQTLKDWVVDVCWQRMKERSQLTRKLEEVEAFNASHKHLKRGVGTVATKFGISFTHTPMNQGGALVHIYRDGSVLVSHGGTEMGQGLHTKMIQVAAQALGVGLHNVIINETATDKVANASPTAASFSSDINGFAILDACGQLMKRLRPRVEQAHNKLFPNTKEAELTSAELDIVWKAAVTQAYADREDLSAHGFCKIPGVRMDWATGTGTPFAYFTQGAAVAVVEIDTLTGDHTVLSADVVMDLGSSLNPGLDAGQVEGAFTQGMGWLTMEELVRGDKQHPWAKPGSLVTQGPGTYKIPSFNDTPLDFNLYLLQDHPNVGPVQLHSSKAVGEPPLFLASSVFFAIKNAIAAKRAEHNVLGDFDVSAPLSCEQIRMACADPVAARFTGNNPQFKTKGSF